MMLRSRIPVADVRQAIEETRERWYYKKYLVKDHREPSAVDLLCCNLFFCLSRSLSYIVQLIHFHFHFCRIQNKNNPYVCLFLQKHRREPSPANLMHLVSLHITFNFIVQHNHFHFFLQSLDQEQCLFAVFARRSQRTQSSSSAATCQPALPALSQGSMEEGKYVLGALRTSPRMILQDSQRCTSRQRG